MVFDAKHYSPYPNDTVIIGHFRSKCANCGIECSYSEKSHQTNLGYSEELRKQPGCGIEWKYAASEYIGSRDEEAVKACRPDLEFVGWERANDYSPPA